MCNNSVCFSERLERGLASHSGVEARGFASKHFQVPRHQPGPVVINQFDLAAHTFFSFGRPSVWISKVGVFRKKKENKKKPFGLLVLIILVAFV